MTSPTISLCVLMDGQESGAEQFFAILAKHVDEIVVVDISANPTPTPPISGIRRYLQPWSGSVAGARNTCLQRSTKDWILWLDADEGMDQQHLEILRDRLSTLDRDVLGVSLPIVRSQHRPWWGTCRDIRLVRNRDQLEFELPIDEQLAPSIRRQEGLVIPCDSPVVAPDDGRQDRYCARSRRALRVLADVHCQGDYHSIDSLYAAGAAHFILGTYAHAECYLAELVTQQNMADLMFAHAIVLLAESCRRLGDLDRAAQICASALEKHPDDPEIESELSELRQSISRGGTWQPPH